MDKIKYSSRLIFILFVLVFSLTAATNEDCLECHEDEEMTMERGGREISVFVEINKFQQSVHGEQECIDCHSDADVDEFPHEDELEKVYCGDCHDDIRMPWKA